MSFQRFSIALTLLVSGSLGLGLVTAAEKVVAPERVLRAATRRTDLSSRGARISRRFDTSLSYIESKSPVRLKHTLTVRQLKMDGRMDQSSLLAYKSLRKLLF
jgi:hypothetical protein